MQIRELLSIILVSLLSVPFPADAKPRVAEKMLEMPEGTQIEVKLRNKDTLTGRLGPISQESFRIQYARGEKVMDREVPFDQVKSVKKVSGAVATETSQKRTVQQQVVEIPTGKAVEVRLTDKSKIRGRIGQVSAEGFLLTAARGSQVGEQKLVFSDVTSVKAIEKEGSGGKSGYLVVGILAGVGALALIGLVVAAASGFSN